MCDVHARLLCRAIQLEKKVDGSTPFFIACQEGRLLVAKVLCDAGADIEAADYKGATPFFSSSQQGHVKIVRYLYGRRNPHTQKPVDSDSVCRSTDPENQLNSTPYDAARDAGHADVLQFLTNPHPEETTFDEVILGLSNMLLLPPSK